MASFWRLLGLVGRSWLAFQAPKGAKTTNLMMIKKEYCAIETYKSASICKLGTSPITGLGGLSMGLGGIGRRAEEDDEAQHVDVEQHDDQHEA